MAHVNDNVSLVSGRKNPNEVYVTFRVVPKKNPTDGRPPVGLVSQSPPRFGRWSVTGP